jgi:predicted ATPase/DNA-binding CsgD family transcriptional regulator
VGDPPRTSEALANDLPVALSSFVGRRRELGELRETLEGTRLLTLTGPGGCGKTRLGLQVATDVSDGFPDGVWWVDLAPLAEERLVAATVAEALGVRPLPGFTELQALCTYLATRQALIVLDNCEHLLGACAEVANALLQASPDAVVLATSRAPLGTGGETEWRVPSLSLPGSVNGEREEFLAGWRGADGGSDAVALFMERATSARPDFALSADDADHVAAICTELDGLPLPIELAAARVRILSVAQIATELSNRLRLLSGGPQTATARLQTIRASVDWSYELLSDQERVLLHRLAVFAGGLTLDAVDEVCAGDGLEHGAVLDLLASLVDQSLLIAEERDGKVRYRMLETVRQYGLERLAEAEEEETLRGTHRDFYLAMAEEATPHLETGSQRKWLELLDPEAANLATAIDCAVDTEPGLALRFCAALYRYWSARGRYAEAELAFSRSLEAAGEREPGLRARALRSRNYLVTQAGDFEAGAVYATEALALAEEVGDKRTSARARMELGGNMQFANPAAARAEMARGAELARAAGDDWAVVHATQTISLTYFFQGDHERAAAATDEVAALAERIGDPFHVGRRWLIPGWIALLDGRISEAREASDRIRAAMNAGDDPFNEGHADAITASVDISQGEPDRAIERLEGRLERALKLGLGLVVPILMVSIAYAEYAGGRQQEARDRLKAILPLIEGRDSYTASWGLCRLAEVLRLQADGGSEQTALRAQANGEQLGNQLLATLPRLTLSRLAAGRDDWTAAQEHALAHLDACAEGGHLTYVPGCLDALAGVAAGLGYDEDGVRLLAAAEGARAEIGIVRVPPEESHWAATEGQLRDALGPDAYEAARREGAELTIDDALEWARRARGPRRRPLSGWGSLTPTEARVAALVAEGLTNPQIGERMFISKATVKTHLAHIFRKLDVHSRTELSAQAARRDGRGSSDSGHARSGVHD